MIKEIKNSNKSNLKLEIKSNINIKPQKSNSNNIKKEFILEGLDCANCAAKIEEKVGKIKGIYSANVNFLTKTLTLEIGEANRTQELISETTDIVQKIEAHVKVKEKQADKSLKKEILLQGLCC